MKERRATYAGFDIAIQGKTTDENPYNAKEQGRQWGRWLDGFYEAYAILQLATSDACSG